MPNRPSRPTSTPTISTTRSSRGDYGKRDEFELTRTGTGATVHPSVITLPAGEEEDEEAVEADRRPEVAIASRKRRDKEKDKMLDANVYATKKTVAQGMLDVALLTANASQLKYLLQVGTTHEFFYLMVTLISLSIVLQIGIGVIILLKSRYNINLEGDHKGADLLNNLIVWLVFGVTVINVFVSAFGIDPGFEWRRSSAAALLDEQQHGQVKTLNQTIH